MAASSSQSPFTSFEKPAALPPAAGFFDSGSFVDIEHCSVVLDLAQAFVGRMAQVALIGPAPKLDLGDQGRLRESKAFALERHDRFSRLQLVELHLRVDCIALLKSGPE